MFWCVRLDDVHAWVTELGYRLIAETGLTRTYSRGTAVLTIRNSPILPELMVDQALNAAEVDPPAGGWEVFQTDP